MVPVSALVERGQLAGVYVVDAQSVARLRLVTVGERQADRAEILSGLEDGEHVVVEGASGVTDGRRVAIGP
jgi:multidrug efflux pump subunit AcrA (membrane-fusion protein)